MNSTDVIEQMNYLNQRISALASQVSQLKTSKLTIVPHAYEKVAPSATSVASDQSSLAKKRGRPTGWRKLYTIEEAIERLNRDGYQLVKRGRGRPKKAA
jgi:hypothetical protein